MYLLTTHIHVYIIYIHTYIYIYIYYINIQKPMIFVIIQSRIVLKSVTHTYIHTYTHVHPAYQHIIMQLIYPQKSFTTLTYIHKYCKFSEIKKEFLNKPITKLNVLRSRAKCVLSQIFTSNTRIKWKYSRW